VTTAGIRAEDRAKIFQPFFSTKKTGRVWASGDEKIIEAHGGKIGFYQNSPRGNHLQD
jgi:signal transduction histidine kinase